MPPTETLVEAIEGMQSLGAFLANDLKYASHMSEHTKAIVDAIGVRD